MSHIITPVEQLRLTINRIRYLHRGMAQGHVSNPEDAARTILDPILTDLEALSDIFTTYHNTLRSIAECKSVVPGDVVDLARKALGKSSEHV